MLCKYCYVCNRVNGARERERGEGNARLDDPLAAEYAGERNEPKDGGPRGECSRALLGEKGLIIAYVGRNGRYGKSCEADFSAGKGSCSS